MNLINIDEIKLRLCFNKDDNMKRNPKNRKWQIREFRTKYYALNIHNFWIDNFRI